MNIATNSKSMHLRKKRAIYLPGAFDEVDNDNDVAAVVARADGLFDFDS